MRTVVGIASISLLLAGCSGVATNPTSTSPAVRTQTPGPLPSTPVGLPSGSGPYSQRAVDWPVPDRNKTPGAVTLVLANGQPCVPGHRPQSDRLTVTSREKATIAANYHVRIVPGMEFDHLLPFALCGSNGPDNLWPEQYDGATKAYDVLNHKDELEKAVYALHLDPEVAQAVFLVGDWRHMWCKLVHKPGVDCRGV